MIPIQLDDVKCLPTRSHDSDAAVDLRSNTDTVTIKPGATVKIDTGLRIAIPEGYGGFVMPRSGLGTMYKLRLANTIGLVDAGYRYNIFVFITNGGTKDYTIEKYDRFAQLAIVKVNTEELCVVPELPGSDRNGGFGHTGVK